MRALVTGGNGFMGSHLVEGLSAEGWEVVVVDRGTNPYFTPAPEVRVVRETISNRGAMREALAGVDVVFHLAWSGVHVSSNQDLRSHVEANLLPSLSLFDVCLEVGVPRVVFVSSGGTVYGKAEELPISEEHATHPINAYGVTKLAVEHYLALYRHLWQLEPVILRPSVAYGERQDPAGLQGAVAVFLGRLLKGEPIVVWGDGGAVRDYFHVSDLVRACLRAATRPVAGEIFNISGGRGVSLRELLELIRRVTGRQPEVRYEEARRFDVPELVLDLGKARELLDWQPRIALEEGLERTWRWIRTAID